MLSKESVDFYRSQGFVLVPDMLDASDLAEAKAVLDRLLAGAANVTQHDHVYDLEPSHTPGHPQVRRIKNPHQVDAVFLKIAQAPALVEVLQQLLGPGIRLHGSKINIKPPHIGSAVEWHQDWAAYPHTNDDVLAVGVMLDDCLDENGPLLVVPGSHRGPILDHHADGRFCGAIAPDNPDAGFDRAVALTGRAGTMSFHHVRTTHGSATNTSAQSRRLLLYEYAAADAWPLSGVPDYDEFNSRLITGKPSNAPRLAEVPVRMPLPKPLRVGSVYEIQATMKQRFFDLPAGEEAKAVRAR